jgi:UDP-2,4-diacetamido-2,4,6-trideoxy-beta-L-altropyranose hydrolase
VAGIGIFMGGTDAADLSSLALRACREQAEFRGLVEIVTTRSYQHMEALKALAATWPETKLLCDLPDLAEFFARHDLQIGAGGGATWERCCVGAPAVVLIAAANQRAVQPALAVFGADTVLEQSAACDQRAVGLAVKALLDNPQRRRELSHRSQTLVDGWGSKRVALWLAASTLAVRPATLGDSEMMYCWRNHPLTRQVSRDSSEIRRADHEHWLRRTLADAQRVLYVGHVGDADVGVIRFDIGEDGQSEVSLYLDPKLHGLGLGRALLRVGEAQLLLHDPRVVGFTATVLDGNQGSMRLFESGGYRLQKGIWQKPAEPPRKN